MSLSIDDLKAQNLILLECISGSRLYGLETQTSDTDIKGVFYLPRSLYYGLHGDYIAQVSNASNDVVYYELGRYVELLLQNNPNIMELLATPADKIRYHHPLMARFQQAWFVSRLCEKTFAGFAQSQIKKARGLNKKIVNPISREKKSVLDFCVVFEQGKSIDLKTWLDTHHLDQSQLGLARMPHATQMYAMYIDTTGETGFSGIIQKPNATQVSLSSIPKDRQPIGYLSFNQMGFSKYCQDYHDYWQWVSNRNEQRYQSTLNHGKQYDAKNMMHTIRLLQMALNIAKTGKVCVQSDNRTQLLAIKSGQYDYDELLEWTQRLDADIKYAFAHSSLPAQPNAPKAKQALYEIRQTLYANDYKSGR